MVMRFLIAIFTISFIYLSSTTFSSCAVMVPPAGGPKDSIAPKLLKSNPNDKSTNVNLKTIVLEFDEFVETEDAFNRITISPALEKPLDVRHRLKTVTIKLADTLQRNTTYKLTVNGAIKDVNEGNKLNDFALIFSTGASIDSNSISGKIILSETGKIDSTLIVALYSNTYDSVVAKEKPKYITKLNGQGEFKFTNLPNTPFKLVAMSDESGQKKYTVPSQQFAFSDSLINTKNNPSNIVLYSFIKEVDKPKPALERVTPDLKLRISTAAQESNQDLLIGLKLIANKKLSQVDTTKFYLTDSSGGKKMAYTFVIDSNKKDITINTNWQPEAKYRLIIDKTAFGDDKNGLQKNDTILFKTKSVKDYGRVTIRFNDVAFAKNPVLQIISNDIIVQSIPINKLKINIATINPGNYDLRILYDDNKNLKWDAGNYYGLKKQPEIARPLTKKLEVKADWDNEIEIEDIL